MAGPRSRLRRTCLAVAAVLLPLAVLPLGASPAAAATTCSGVQHDMDGDGFAEVAVGEPGGGSPAGGRVHVFFGTATGPTATSTTAPSDLYLAQGVGGVPGSDTAGDDFGAATAFGDFDSDGCADLAIGVPGNSRDCGAVVVLFGAPEGLFTAGPILSEDSATASGVPREPCSREGRPGERFGASLAVGDLDGGGDDLVVGAPGDTAGSAGGRDRGAVAVFYGSGLKGSFGGGQLLDQSTPGVSGSPEDGDRFGAAVAVIAEDLVIGVPGEDAGRGQLQVVRGNSQDTCGPTPLCLVLDLVIRQGSDFIREPAEAGDLFGAAIASGDVTNAGTGKPDVVVGSPGENNGRGRVFVLTSGGLGGLLSEFRTVAVDQDSPGVDGVAAAGDRFGASVAVGRLDSDTFADVVVGAPLDDVAGVRDAGSVTLLRGAGTRSFVGDYGGVRLTQDSVGVPGTAERGDRFGRAVAVTDVTGNGLGNVLVGSPGEDLGGIPDVGSLTALAPSGVGPSAIGSTFFEPDSPGVLGVRRAGAAMGAAVG